MTAADQLTGKLLDIINQVQSGIVAHAPDAVNLVLASTQIDCLQSIILSFIGVIVSIICGFIIFKIQKKIDADKKDNKPYHERLTWIEPEAVLPALFAGLSGSIILVISVITLLDIWNWVGLFNPKLYLAHQIIAKVMS